MSSVANGVIECEAAFNGRGHVSAGGAQEVGDVEVRPVDVDELGSRVVAVNVDVSGGVGGEAAGERREMG